MLLVLNDWLNAFHIILIANILLIWGSTKGVTNWIFVYRISFNQELLALLCTFNRSIIVKFQNITTHFLLGKSQRPCQSWFLRKHFFQVLKVLLLINLFYLEIDLQQNFHKDFRIYRFWKYLIHSTVNSSINIILLSMSCYS